MPLLRFKLRNPLINNTLALVTLRGSTTVTRLILIFIMALSTSPDIFGMIVFAIATAEIAKIIADFGVDTITIRELASTHDTTAQRIVMANVAGAKLVCSLLVYSLVLAGAWLTQTASQTHFIMVAGLLIPTYLWTNYTINYFQAHLRIQTIVAALALTNILAVILVVVLWAANVPVLYLLATLPLAEAIGALVLWFYLKKALAPRLPCIRPRAIYRILRTSFPLASAAIIVTLYTRLDIFILSYFVSITDVGHYGIAFRVTEPFQLIAVAFSSSIYSHLSRILSQSHVDIWPIIKRYLTSIVFYGCLVFALLAAIAPLFINHFLPEYAPATTILRVLAGALIFRSLNTCLTSVIQAYGYFRWMTIGIMANFFIIVSLLLLFVPIMGAVGASIALLLGEIINTLIQATMIKIIIARGFIVTTVQTINPA
jgi:O-antigen/teichoic acid export membrane protein